MTSQLDLRQEAVRLRRLHHNFNHTNSYVAGKVMPPPLSWCH
jgi:predicted unusual protein kinase regulating ubiquinone biosynthesis (AarF/ABC1/UbiB family)